MYRFFHYMAGWVTKLHGLTIPLSVPYTPTAHYHSYARLEPVGVKTRSCLSDWLYGGVKSR